MIAPTAPADEVERLAALYALNILDTPPEDRFDRITRLASGLFGVPVAYIAFVDANRQWFKSTCGLATKETTRDVSFCGHTILQSEPLVIPDTHSDPRFADNPLVTGTPFIRFYAGHPLATADGFNVGTLCLVDHAPRTLSEADLKLLCDLARTLEDQLKLLDVTDLQQELVAARRELRQANEQLAERNRFIRDAVGRYLTDQVAQTVLDSPEALELGGEQREVTLLMSDLRGFTSLCERMPPDRVVHLLNRYLGTMVDVILQHGGTIDGFIGDAILVVFGAPRVVVDAAGRAVACAVEMQRAMDVLNADLDAEGLPRLDMGVGINTGEVIVGNIGSARRMKYSVIGRAVNLAARIESITLGGQILISASTLEAVGPERLQLDGHLRVKMKGISEPVVIYEVTGIAKDEVRSSKGD